MKPTHNMVGWFEIPVRDMERAIKFYESVFDIKLERHRLGPLDMAWFPGPAGSMGAGGALVCQPEHYQPSADGILIYFTAFSGDVATELARMEKAGGKVLMPKRLIADDIGYMAVFQDTEGNRVALHARKS